MPNPSTPAAPAPETWAEVRTRDRVMRYCRCGVGPYIIVLRHSSADDLLWPELGEALSVRYRLITPEPPALETDLARWLADFAEGLGLARFAVIAADGFCIPALELALLGAEQCTQVVLVPGGSADDTGLTGTLATSTREAGVSLLLVRRGHPADEAVPLVMTFLGQEATPAPG